MAGKTEPSIDVGMLHWHLWDRQLHERRGFIELRHAELADELGVTRGRVSQIVGELVEAGRLERKTSRSRYSVVDPSSSPRG